MDAVKFIKERNRMCKSFCSSCKECPASNEDDLCCAVGNESTLDAIAQIAIVEEWSAAHPRKTRQSVFLEQYPEAALDAYGVLRVCPMYLSAEYRDDCNGCKNIWKKCSDCRREFWMQEVEV